MLTQYPPQPFQVHINNGVRSSLLGADASGPDQAEAVRTHFAATAELQARLASAKYTFERMAEPGDIWVFDNRRVLHGRRALLSASAGGRVLEGAYVEWDALDSCARLIGERPGLHG